MRRASFLLAVLALGGGVGPGSAAGQSDPHLRGGLLSAEVVSDGSARAVVRLELGGTASVDRLPLRVLAFGSVPEGVTASLDGGVPGPVALTRVRPGLWEAEVPLSGPPSASRELRLEYGLGNAVHGEGGSGTGLVLAIPWLAVPWPPPDGSPGRVEIRVEIPAGVELEATFPAALTAVDGMAGATGQGRRIWTASLPVLPSLTRGRVRGSGLEGAAARDAEAREAPEAALGGPGSPPPAAPPGLVFTGLFWAFLLVVAGYALWMRGRG